MNPFLKFITLAGTFTVIGCSSEIVISEENRQKYHTNINLTGEILDYQDNLTMVMVSGKMKKFGSFVYDIADKKEIEVKYERIEIKVLSPKEFENRILIITSKDFEENPPFEYQSGDFVQFETTRFDLGLKLESLSLSQFESFKQIESNKAGIEISGSSAPRNSIP